MCDVICSHVWRDVFICGAYLVRTCDMTHSYVRCAHLYVWRDSFASCDMTHSYVWQDLFMEGRDSFIGSICLFVCVTWLIHMRDMTHTRDMYSYVWHDVYSSAQCVSFLPVTPISCMCNVTIKCVTWLIDMCDHPQLSRIIQLYKNDFFVITWWFHVDHYSNVTHVYKSCHALYEWVMSRIWMGRVTHLNESRLHMLWWLNHLSVTMCPVYTYGVALFSRID